MPLKILECNIMRFGTLSDFHYDLTQGINRIVRGNGFGKSTLAAFLRVMLYGFEGEGKRDALSRERKFYEPWQGGNYGGDIVFEVGEKRYRVTRTFGKKADSDTFELRDMTTNLVSHDYSDKLGVELFDMDSDTFRKTVFVGQDGVETSVNDTINGRIGALVDNTDDLDAFEKAKTSLEEMILSLTPRRKTGEVSRLNDRITELDHDILPAADYEQTMESVLSLRSEEEEKLRVLKSEKEDLAAKAKELGAYMEVASKKERYETLLADRDEKSLALEAAKSGLPEGLEIADLPEANELRTLAKNYMIARSELSGTELLSLDPREEETLGKLSPMYGGQDPASGAEKHIENWHYIKMLDKEIAARQEALEMTKAEEQKKKTSMTRNRLLAMLGVLILIAVAVYCFLNGSFVIGGIAAAAVLATLIAMTVAMKPSRAVLAGYAETLNDISAGIEKAQNKRDETLVEIGDFLKNFKKDSDPEMILVSLKEVISENETYRSLKSKKERAGSASEKSLQVMKETENYIGERLKTDVADDPYLQLTGFADNTDRARSALSAFEAAQNALDVFVRDNDISVISGTQTPGDGSSLRSVTDRLSEVSRLADESADRLAGFDKRSDELSDTLEEIAEKKLLRESLIETRNKKQEMYECCVIAKEHLIEAKETLSARYIMPIYEKFIHYHTMITGSNTGEYMVDANIDVSVKEQGLTHSVLQLSRGLRDVVGLSLRMAFIDVMFPGEKPVLILDDPFVNLDRANYEAAEKLLNIISGEYQVIYFTARDEFHEEIAL